MAHHLEDENTILNVDQGLDTRNLLSQPPAVYSPQPESQVESTLTRTSNKRSRYVGYEDLDGDQKRQKDEVLPRQCAKYRLNRGLGMFTFYRRGGMNPEDLNAVPGSSAPPPVPTDEPPCTYQGQTVGSGDVEMTDGRPQEATDEDHLDEERVAEELCEDTQADRPEHFPTPIDKSGEVDSVICIGTIAAPSTLAPPATLTPDVTLAPPSPSPPATFAPLPLAPSHPAPEIPVLSHPSPALPPLAIPARSRPMRSLPVRSLSTRSLAASARSLAAPPHSPHACELPASAIPEPSAPAPALPATAEHSLEHHILSDSTLHVEDHREHIALDPFVADPHPNYSEIQREVHECVLHQEPSEPPTLGHSVPRPPMSAPSAPPAAPTPAASTSASVCPAPVPPIPEVPAPSLPASASVCPAPAPVPPIPEVPAPSLPAPAPSPPAPATSPPAPATSLLAPPRSPPARELPALALLKPSVPLPALPATAPPTWGPSVAIHPIGTPSAPREPTPTTSVSAPVCPAPSPVPPSLALPAPSLPVRPLPTRPLPAPRPLPARELPVPALPGPSVPAPAPPTWGPSVPMSPISAPSAPMPAAPTPAASTSAPVIPAPTTAPPIPALPAPTPPSPISVPAHTPSAPPFPPYQNHNASPDVGGGPLQEVERAIPEVTDNLVGSLREPNPRDIGINGSAENADHDRTRDEWETRGFQEIEPIVVRRQPGNNVLERESRPNLASDRVVLNPSELAPSTCIQKLPDVLSPELEEWVSSQVNNALEQARLKTEQRKRDQEVAHEWSRKAFREKIEEQAKETVETMFREKLGTWKGTPESLRCALKKSASDNINKVMTKFDNDGLEYTERIKIFCQDKENQVAQQAREVALAKIKNIQAGLMVPPRADEYQQEAMRSNEAWLEREAALSAQEKAKKATSQGKRGHRATVRKSSVLSVKPVVWKGKKRATTSVNPTNGLLTDKSSRAPMLEPLSASQQQGPFDMSHCMTTMPDPATTQPSDEPRFTEDFDADMDVDPLGGPMEDASPFAFPPDEQPATKSLLHPSFQVDPLQYEAAEERRRNRKAQELEEEREKARRERKADQQRLQDLADTLLDAREYLRAEDALGAEREGTYTHAFSEVGEQSRSAQENMGASTSNIAPLNSATSMDVGAGERRQAASDLSPIRERSNDGVTAGGSQMSDGAILNRLLEHVRMTDERQKKMASQFDRFMTAFEGGGLGTNPVSQAPPVTPVQPSPVTPRPSQSRSRRNCPPGTFREPVPEVKHRKPKSKQFHRNMRAVILDLLHKGNADFWPDPPTEDEIENFATLGDPEDGPTFEKFRLDFSHKPLHKSIWNRRAAEIFVEQYCLSYDDATLSEIEGEFLLKRLYRLMNDYLDHKKSPTANDAGRASATAKRQRRFKRMDTLYKSCLTAIESHETLHRFIPALKHLSRGGMSEDESDHGGERGALQGRRFGIVKLQWRSPEATKWLRTMDLIYAGTKINEDQTSQPGNQFRQRYPSTTENVGSPIIGLPRNFYDERWLKTLSHYQRVQLRIQPEIDINFSSEERQHASRFIGLKGRLQKDRIASSAEADKDEISQWVLTGAGFWKAV